MQARNQARIFAGLAAIAVAGALFAGIGPAVHLADHALHRAFDALSPQGRAIATAVGQSLPYWLPGTMVALCLCVAGWRRGARPAKGEVDEPSERERLDRSLKA